TMRSPSSDVTAGFHGSADCCRYQPPPAARDEPRPDDMSFDPTMQAIMDTIADSEAGREEKRARFAAIWGELGEDADPIHRCILAHYMADVQDGPEEALLWDQRALDAARGMDEDEFAA